MTTTAPCIDCGTPVTLADMTTAAPKCPHNIGATGVQYGHRVPTETYRAMEAEALEADATRNLHLAAVTTTRALLNQSGPVLTGTQATIVALVQRHMEYQIRAAKDFQGHDAMDEAAARGAQDALEYAISLLTRTDPAEVAMVLLAATD